MRLRIDLGLRILTPIENLRVQVPCIEEALGIQQLPRRR